MTAINWGPFAPASTYPDILNLNSGGLGLTNNPTPVCDGYGNRTMMTMSSLAINFDRTFGQFQLDGIALTASATTLNNISFAADASYILASANAGLPNGLIIQSGTGINVLAGGGNMTINASGELLGLANLNTTGVMVRTDVDTYTTTQFTSNNATLTVTNGTGVAGNVDFSVNPSTTVQKINVWRNGTPVSTRSNINFIQGANVSLTVNDDAALNSTDVIISTTGSEPVVFKAACYASSTANLNATYNNGAAGVGATLTNGGALAAFVIDGVNPGLNARILIKNQTAPAQNGIYALTTVGSGAVAWVLTRTIDFNSNTNIVAGAFTLVTDGTVNNNTSWIQENVVNVVGTDPIQWFAFGSVGSVTSVTGTAGQIDVVNPNTTPVISIDPGYIGQASITTLGTITTGVWNGTVVGLGYGGTNANLVPSNGGIVYSTAGALAILPASATSFQPLMSRANAAPAWSSTTYPSLVSQYDILYSLSNNSVNTLGTSPSSVLTTTLTGLPFWASSLPLAVQANIDVVGTIITGVWNGTPITVPYGGTGLATLGTAYGVVCAGTTATGNLQNAGAGTAGQILTSNGAAALPTWQSPSSLSLTVTVNQNSHGFIVGNIIRCNGSNTYTLAQADNQADATGVTGIVITVIDANNFIYQCGGLVTIAGATLTAATGYFLSATSAGAYTATEPVTAGTVSKSVFFAITTTTALWLNYPYQKN